MKTLIIYAHPETEGHCINILNEVEKRLKFKRIDYELIDLYKINYDPVLKDSEHYTSGNFEITKQNKDFQNKISKANKLIFIYPNWWNSMPAVLKGFIDRVFVARFAFRYKGRIPYGLLKGKKAVVFLTTGAPLIFFKIIEGSRAKKSISKDILKFSGIKSKVFIISNSFELNKKQMIKIKKAVKKGLNYLYGGV